MGINGLASLIKKFAPNTITKKKLFCYSGKIVAIDTSLFIHKFLYNWVDYNLIFLHSYYSCQNQNYVLF